MEKLGVEPVQLLIQIFNFLVMVFVLSKLLYRPILKVLDERKRKIEDGLAFAERAKQELETSNKKRQEIIDKAKEEARKIIEEGKKSGRRLEAEIVEKAHKEAKAILEKGRAESETEKQEMEKQLGKKTAGIAMTMVETVLGQVLDLKDHKTIINRRIQELAKLTK